MRIVIGYPPLEDERGHHQTGQNRQAQIFVHGAYIYPVVPALAATMLREAGHTVIWLDGEAQGITWQDYVEQVKFYEADLVAWEVKTPSVKGTWKRVDELKSAMNVKVVLFGDHVTAMPEESMLMCQVDTVLTGGDYDFGLLDIVENDIKGIYAKPTDTKLDTLPIVDRYLTKYSLYAYENGSGNYKYLPGTHTYWGRDCWWRKDGGCTFCSWTNTFKNFRVVPVAYALEEVAQCDKLGIREVFDDTGTFPVGSWLYEFCEGIIKWRERTGSKLRLGCNMRPGALGQKEYDLLGRAGFRFILYGLESANHQTLVRINKGQKPGDMESTLRMAKRAGLEPHVTVMGGYPWETVEDLERTVSFTRDLFRKGLIDTLQATIVIPYPGTALYKECLANDWLKYAPGFWENWDMSKPVMKTCMTDEEVLRRIRGIYKSCINLPFVMRKVFSVRDKDDLAYLLRGARFAMGHLMDFSGKR